MPDSAAIALPACGQHESTPHDTAVVPLLNVIDAGHQRVMQSSTGGFVPRDATQIRDSALCATCHTLYTVALDEGGNRVGELPEQVPYLEWQHSDYANKASCQSCHMAEVPNETAVTSLFGQPRQGTRHHTFLGGNFFMLRMLSDHREDLNVTALPGELNANAERTVNFLQSHSARVSIQNVDADAGKLRVDVLVENLTGHKLPTAYPSRRAWLHVTIKDRNGLLMFESGALNADGSIKGISTTSIQLVMNHTIARSLALIRSRSTNPL